MKTREVKFDPLARAKVLHQELSWLQSMIALRLGQAFTSPKSRSKLLQQPESPPLPEILPAPAISPKDPTPLAALIRQHHLDYDERLLLALALTPQLQPDLLGSSFSGELIDATEWPDTGLLRNIGSPYWLPSGQTFVFLRGGFHLPERLHALACLSGPSALVREGVLGMEPPLLGSPLSAGRLYLNLEWLDLLLLGLSAESTEASLRHPQSSTISEPESTITFRKS